MFISRIVILALPVFATATFVPRAGGKGSNKNNTTNSGGNNSCSQGTSQFCCNNLQSASSFSAENKWLLNVFGINANSFIGQVGINCNPVVASSSGCNAQSVCCQGSQGNGIIANNCSPVIVNA